MRCERLNSTKQHAQNDHSLAFSVFWMTYYSIIKVLNNNPDITRMCGCIKYILDKITHLRNPLLVTKTPSGSCVHKLCQVNDLTSILSIVCTFFVQFICIYTNSPNYTLCTWLSNVVCSCPPYETKEVDAGSPIRIFIRSVILSSEGAVP